MKKIILSATVIAACAVMVSCEKENTPVNDDRMVQFTSGITATPTRVSIDSNGKSVWEEGDPIGIYMLENGTDVVAENAANRKYTASSSGLTTNFAPVENPIYYPGNLTATVDFIGYHPYNNAASGFAYPIDVSNQASQTGIDFLWAKADNHGAGYNKNDEQNGINVNFTFKHQLVKLILRVKNGAGVTGDLSTVSINGMYTRASFDLKGAGGITGMSDARSFAPATVTRGTIYEAILLPVESLGAGHTVTFINESGEEFTWVMTDKLQNLVPGTIYDYEITLTKIKVTANGTIDQWTVGSTGSGTAE